MKKEIFLLMLLLLPVFAGCTALDQLYDKTEPIENEAGEIVDQQGEMELKPVVKSSINFAGDVAPFPWAGLAASGLLNILTAYGSIRGRKWKKAASSSVAAGNQFRKVVKEVKPDLYNDIKDRIIGDQNAAGTRPLIKSILGKLT